MQGVEVSASTQEILDEIEQQFNDLLASDPAGNQLSVVQSALPIFCAAVGETPSAALMVLSGLNNLFSPVEHATSQLYKLVDKMTTSDNWNCVDIISQSAKLKVTSDQCSIISQCSRNPQGWIVIHLLSLVT